MGLLLGVTVHEFMLISLCHIMKVSWMGFDPLGLGFLYWEWDSKH